MNRRGLMGLAAALALAAFTGIRAETADTRTKTKANVGCACCGDACACSACSCDAIAKVKNDCPCCGGAACCPDKADEPADAKSCR
jgi:hypothetical protein